MAALLVGMSIMAILMGAALPVWNKQAQREREEEYLFRAHEYARAVMKFRQRIANTNPPSVDVLVEQRFLRRKYKDPITGEDFQLVYQTAGAGIQPGAPGSATPGTISADRRGAAGRPGRDVHGRHRRDVHGRHRRNVHGRHRRNPDRRHWRSGARRRHHRRGLEEQGLEHQDLQRAHALRPVGGDLPGREARQGIAA